MRRDLANRINLKPAIQPVVVTDNTPQASAIIDTAGYESLTFAIETGTLADADATFAVTMEHGDDAALADTAAPAATDLIGTTALASFTFAADGACRKIGYIGTKRYVRMTITPSNNTGNAPLAAIAILGDAKSRPTANPPA
ncbi:hypothetical protein [Methylosinus sp. LW4]|uniref:hypothetical protein n=1 Tax=Methylosinus sp. LW4 TaxID=136993 RepID=UPI000361192A|nr:hypothetical protein [Methylosinus sp. LW4]